jgi:hypothetical protein
MALRVHSPSITEIVVFSFRQTPARSVKFSTIKEDVSQLFQQTPPGV